MLILSQSFLAHLDAQAVSCNYTSYLDTFLTYPPKGVLPFPTGLSSSRTARGCDIWDEIFDAALMINPAFDIYRIFDTVSFSTLYTVTASSYLK